MRSAISLLATAVLVSSLIAGCGCLAADGYDKPACQKYDTHWPRPITTKTKRLPETDTECLETLSMNGIFLLIVSFSPFVLRSTGSGLLKSS